MVEGDTQPRRDSTARGKSTQASSYGFPEMALTGVTDLLPPIGRQASMAGLAPRVQAAVDSGNQIPLERDPGYT